MPKPHCSQGARHFQFVTAKIQVSSYHQAYFSFTKSVNNTTSWAFYQWYGNSYLSIDNSMCMD